MANTEPLAWNDVDIAQPGALFDARQIGPPTHADHPDFACVALDQRVDGLRGRMRDEVDVAGPDLVRQLGHGLYDTGRNSAVGGVRGRHDDAGNDRMAGELDRHRLGEGAADIDSDSDPSHVAAAARWR